MIDLQKLTLPKTDQLNADCLYTGPKTIKITKVVEVDDRNQPLQIFYNGDDGRPYKPCLTMRRVLMLIWDNDASTFVGRRMTLFRDPTATMNGAQVGGIRISNMDGLTEPVTLNLTAKKGMKKPYTVNPLADEVVGRDAPTIATLDELRLDAEEAAKSGSKILRKWFEGIPKAEQRIIKPHMEEYKDAAAERDAEIRGMEQEAEEDQRLEKES